MLLSVASSKGRKDIVDEPVAALGQLDQRAASIGGISAEMDQPFAFQCVTRASDTRVPKLKVLSDLAHCGAIRVHRDRDQNAIGIDRKGVRITFIKPTPQSPQYSQYVTELIDGCFWVPSHERPVQ